MEKATKFMKKKIKNKENLIENILTNGVTIFAGSPKIGKTFFLLQMASALSSKNSYFLGNKCLFTKVLYFSNETSKIEIKSRLDKLTGFDNLYLNFNRNLGINDIELEIFNNKKTKNERLLLIIDTLQNINYAQNFDNNNYKDMYKLINQYMQLSEKHNCSFILVHHLNKSKDPNIFNSINGSVAMTGSAENLMILTKDDDNEYQLLIESRYMASNTFNLTRKENGFFDCKNSEKLLVSNNIDINTLTNFIALQKEKFIEASASEICAKAHLKFITSNILYKELQKNEEFLKQCHITFSYKKSNGSRKIKIELKEDEENETC